MGAGTILSKTCEIPCCKRPNLEPAEEFRNNRKIGRRAARKRRNDAQSMTTIEFVTMESAVSICVLFVICAGEGLVVFFLLEELERGVGEVSERDAAKAYFSLRLAAAWTRHSYCPLEIATPASRSHARITSQRTRINDGACSSKTMRQCMSLRRGKRLDSRWINCSDSSQETVVFVPVSVPLVPFNPGAFPLAFSVLVGSITFDSSQS